MPGDESTYGVAFVGTGKIAHTHALSVIANPMTELSAAADPNPAALSEFAAFYNSKRGDKPPLERLYTSHTELFADDTAGGIDIVGVYTPPGVTHFIAGAGLEADAHIFCEKPIATTIRDAVRLYTIAQRHPGQVFAVDFIYAAEPGFTKIKEWSDSGLLGEVRRYLFRKINEPNTGPEAENNIVKPYFDAEAGPLFTGGSHYLYLILLYTKGKRRITYVEGNGVKTQHRYPRPNHEVAFLHFDDNSLAEVGIGWLSVLPKNTKGVNPALYDVVIEGTQGTVLYDAETGVSSLYNQEGLVEQSEGKANRYQVMWDRTVNTIMRKAKAVKQSGVDVPGIVEGLEDVLLGATIDRAMVTGRKIIMPDISDLRHWLGDMEEDLFAA